MNESNLQQNTGKASDEIDIFEFSSRMWTAFIKFLVSIKNLIISIIIFLIRKSLWIVSFGLAGVLIGILFYGISRPFYSSSLEGTTGGIYDIDAKQYIGGVDNTAVIDHINKLDKAVSKPQVLANYLGMSVEQAKEIRSIKAYYGIDVDKDMKPDYVDEKETYNPKDTNQIRVPSFVHIKVSVYDESIFSELRRGILRYINSNAYIQKLHEIDRLQKEEMINELEKEIKTIEEIQQARIRKESSIDQGSFVVLGNEPEPKLFYGDILYLRSRIQLLDRNLKISDEIVVIVQDFTPLEQEERTIVVVVGVFGAIMVIIGIFCALLWQYRKRIWELISENSAK